ncbi:MAG: peptidyl-prolyl cis-trans isomerase cyclophilin type [Solirubrobacterales bacterium]|nr:peptidyl-prolyl cis-trans isomerase cyclophilin type [Solirubrobacterales bacterium]
MTRRLLPVLLTSLGLGLGLGACGSSDSSGTTSGSVATTAAKTASTPAAAAPARICPPAEAQKAIKRTAKKPTSRLDPARTWVVRMKTSCGDFEITLDVKAHPVTASSFGALAKAGFYDGLGVVRVVPGFVLQAGDPNGDGTGDAGYQVVEPPGNNAAYRKGVIAMAKTGADPAGASSSQFFVVTGPDAGLPPDYAIAGRVTKGLDVAEKIGSIPPAGPDPSPPVEPVVIEKATLASK